MKRKANDICRRFSDKLLELIETLIISLFTVTILFTFFFRITGVSGVSMEETLKPDDKIIITAWYTVPKQGDVVVINADEAVTFDESGSLISSIGMNSVIVKRVIAVEGQTIDFDFEHGVVYVDGEVYSEPYISGLTHHDEGAFTGRYPITIPEGYVFVMGDNRRNSQDSRSSELGLVSVDNIIGKAVLKIYPLRELGAIK